MRMTSPSRLSSTRLVALPLIVFSLLFVAVMSISVTDVRADLIDDAENAANTSVDSSSNTASSSTGTLNCETAKGDGPCLTTESTVFKPLGNVSVQEIVGNVIKYIVGLTGVIALVMFIYGGVMWMTAGGNTERVGKAKNTLIWATLGLVMVFAAYAIVNTVIQALEIAA